jgi:hypothetical protein
MISLFKPVEMILKKTAEKHVKDAKAVLTPSGIHAEAEETLDNVSELVS